MDDHLGLSRQLALGALTAARLGNPALRDRSYAVFVTSSAPWLDAGALEELVTQVDRYRVPDGPVWLRRAADLSSDEVAELARRGPLEGRGLRIASDALERVGRSLLLRVWIEPGDVPMTWQVAWDILDGPSSVGGGEWLASVGRERLSDCPAPETAPPPRVARARRWPVWGTALVVAAGSAVVAGVSWERYWDVDPSDPDAVARWRQWQGLNVGFGTLAIAGAGVAVTDLAWPPPRFRGDRSPPRP